MNTQLRVQIRYINNVQGMIHSEVDDVRFSPQAHGQDSKVLQTPKRSEDGKIHFTMDEPSNS